MDYLFNSNVAGIGGLGHNHGRRNDDDAEWASGRPAKKLRTSVSHGSFLQPLIKAAKDPFETLGSLAETLGYAPYRQEENEEEVLRERDRQLLLLKLQSAKSYDEWRLAAADLDRLEGNELWKEEEQCAEYDVKLVKARLRQLEEARNTGDAKRMLFLVRTSLTRDLGGMGDLRLYKHSRVGTKTLIERYIETALDTLDVLVRASGSQGGLDPRDTMEQILAARQSFGRSALLLSGGGTFGMNHIGVIKSLYEANLLPRIISGASAGSIVCSVLCTRLDHEIPVFLDEFCYGDLEVFNRSDQPDGVLAKAARFLKFGAVYDISNLVRVMRDMLGDMTFQEAYNRTRRILNICVSSANLYELPRLLNYVTAPNVIIWSAVAASCSVPFIFSAAQLLAKDPKTGEEVPWNPSSQRWIDGSVDNDLPMTRLAEMFNVNHFIVSQVNPHVVPFLAKEEEAIAAEAQRTTETLQAGPGWMQSMASLAKGEALHRMHVLTELGILPTTMTKLRSVLGQRYSGDITIFPDISYTNFPAILANPTTEFIQQAMANGERATWPKMSRIRNHCAIELALDDTVQKLRARVVFSPSQIDLRLNAFSRDQPVRSDRGRLRRGSKGSHKSARSTIVPRSQPEQKSRHRPVKSMHDPPSVPLTAPAVPILKVPGPSPIDYFSSGESDAGRSSSPTQYSDADDDSESDDVPSESSFDSPPSPQPTLWPSTRLLFPSISQPVTPSVSRAFSMSPTSTRAQTPAPTSRKSSTALSNIKTSTLGVLTKQQQQQQQPPPSSPEVRYKRLFHGGVAAALQPMPTIRSQASTPDPEKAVESASGSGSGPDTAIAPPKLRRSSSRFGLHLDISGTRGMVRRRKRSLSTGLKGLWPPGKQ